MSCFKPGRRRCSTVCVHCAAAARPFGEFRFRDFFVYRNWCLMMQTCFHLFSACLSESIFYFSSQFLPDVSRAFLKHLSKLHLGAANLDQNLGTHMPDMPAEHDQTDWSNPALRWIHSICTSIGSFGIKIVSFF